MRENLEHHIAEVEGDMFKKVRQVFDKGELATLGAAMGDRKQGAHRDPAAAS
jgi:hypothetical protein